MTSNYILAISGSDILSGGGLQADLATFSAHHLFGFVAITCIATVSESGFTISPVNQDLFNQQLASLSEVPFKAIKIGLLPNRETIGGVRTFLTAHPTIPVVLDPVLVFKENDDENISMMRKELLGLVPYATIITPNLREAELLSGIPIRTLDDMKQAAKVLGDMGARRVVIKGGARLSQEKAIDLVYDGEVYQVFESPIVPRNNNGAGCTFASAIAAHLARGEAVIDAVRLAKSFVYHAIEQSNEYGVNQHHEKTTNN